MRIIWLTSQLLPKIAEQINKKNIGSGGWVISMIQELQKSEIVTALDIVSVYKGSKIITIEENNIRYTLLPSKNGIFRYDKNLWKNIQKEIQIFNPDIIDVQGIEFFLVKSLLDTQTSVPIVATLQGLTNEIYKHYYAGIPYNELIRNRTFRDNLLFDGIIERKYQYKERGKNEIYALKSLHFVLGRTSWDHIYSSLYNPNIQYFKCNRNLREAFYNQSWDIDKIEKYSILITQAHYPIKGLHLFLEALQYIIQKYPQTRLYISGKNMIDKGTLFKFASFSGYQKYILKLIKKYKLKNNIAFTGFLNEVELVERLKKTHIFVLPSVMENSPNALAEAQLIGVPCVASYVGGIIDYIQQGETGFLYNCYEPLMLCDKIEQIYLDDSLAKRLSTNAQKVAIARHDKEKNVKDLINAYKTIIDNKNEPSLLA